ncbi:DUF4174 domain-containing protein [Roseobacter insulae]|nr:DUF4174 domain-containing protein [Roseobacter insulae]
MSTNMKNNVHDASDPMSSDRPDRPVRWGERHHSTQPLAAILMVNMRVLPIAYPAHRLILVLTGDAMKRILPLVLACFFANAPAAQTAEAELPEMLFVTMEDADLKQFIWKKRPVVVFADSENNPAYIEQMRLLHEREEELDARDVVVITDTDPDAKSDLRQKLRPRGFMLVLIGKDGGVKLRKPFPWDVREISRSIDKMPMRQREIREQKDRAIGR